MIRNQSKFPEFVNQKIRYEMPWNPNWWQEFLGLRSIEAVNEWIQANGYSEIMFTEGFPFSHF